MSDDISRMRMMLEAAINGVGVRGDRAVNYDEGGMFFSIGESGIEVALEQGSDGGFWRVRELYEVADIKEGGHVPVAGTVSLHRLGDELVSAKSAVMKVLERRVDSALDAVA